MTEKDLLTLHPTAEDQLSPADAEQVRVVASRLAGEHNQTVFILGSYDDNDVGRLDEFQRLANERRGLSGVLMRDIDTADGANGMWKCRLCGHYSNEIVVICEHDRGGAVLEQGMIWTDPALLEKTHLLKRTYPDPDQSHENYSWMHSNGLFDTFDSTGRLYEWGEHRSVPDFQTSADSLLDEIL